MVELAWPWVLVFLPLPWMIWLWAPRAVFQVASALKVPFFAAMLGMMDNKKLALSSHAKPGLMFFIWSLLLLALADPRWVGQPQPVMRDGYHIMLALDLSGSMELNDMIWQGRPVTRLAVVKRAAEQFVQDRPGDKLGLILFGSQAYLQTPLTYDRHSVLMRIEDATVGLAGKTTSIGDALGLAVKRLQNVPKKGRVIILLTDGVNNSGVLAPLKAAELAQADKIKIYTIGLGAEVDPRAMQSLLFHMNVTADLDEETLKEVAKMTGGKYFRATDLNSLQTIYQSINQMERQSQEQATVRPQHDYYPWPLGVALCLLFYALADKAGWTRFIAPKKSYVHGEAAS
jgi:Ca-activated chloride channel family protein